MAKFQNPGAFFLGTLVAQEQKFLKPLIENARKHGYTRFVEPCAGAFAMSHIAAQCGYKPSEIEASDVSMFTSIMGYAITGQSLEERKSERTASRMRSCLTLRLRSMHSCTCGL